MRRTRGLDGRRPRPLRWQRGLGHVCRHERGGHCARRCVLPGS